MRLLRAKIPLFAICVIALSYTPAKAQLFECIEGTDYTTFTQDSLRIVSFQGLPGDTVEMPLRFRADSVILGMTVNVRYPGDVLTPITFPDTAIDTTIDNAVIPPDTTIDTSIIERIDIREVGRARIFDTLQDAFGFDSIVVRDLFRSNSVKVRDSSLLKIQWLPRIPAPGQPLDSVPGGNGEIVRVKFVVNPGFAEGTVRALSLEHLPVLDTSFFPPIQTGCALTATAQNWVVAFLNPDPPPDTLFQVLSLLQVPVLTNGNFKVDTALPPAGCNSNSDCPPRAGNTVQCIAQSCVYDTVITGCTTPAGCPDISGFTKDCINNECVYTPIGGGHAPTVDPITPNLIDVLQGELVSFTVTGRDDSASHTITLSASGMPAGASFNSTPANSVVNGAFSWTPGFGQSGAFVVSFTASDNTGQTSAPVTVTINVQELQFDQLFTTSAPDMAPVGGIPGFRDAVFFPIDLLSLQPDVFGIQFDLMYPHRQIRIDSIITTDRTPAYIVDWIAMNDSLIRVVSLGLNNEPIVDGTSSSVLNVALTIDSTAVPGVYDMLLSNGRESIDPDPTVGSVQLLTLPGVVEVDILGDVNIDRIVDVADMVNVVGYIIGSFTFPNRNFATADVTANDTVDVVDLVGINNLIFELPIQAPPGPGNVGGPQATVILEDNLFNAGGFSSLPVVGDFPEDVAGVEVEVDYNPTTVSMMTPELTDASREYALRYRDDKNGKMKAVIYSFSPLSREKLIKQGVAEVIRFPILTTDEAQVDDVTLASVTLANPQAGKIETDTPVEPVKPETFYLSQNYPNPFNPETNIDFAIDRNPDGAALQHVTLRVYNILGQQVRTLVDREMEPGQYTVQWDGANSSGKKVASGVYLYRLQVSSGRAISKKMILVK